MAEDERNEAVMAAWRGENPNVTFPYEPCAREHEEGRTCMLPNEHEKDPVFMDFLSGSSNYTSPIARHLMLCPTSHHQGGTRRGITCSHDMWWGLDLGEQAYMANKI